jgi:glc operon protein GlcG
MVLIEPSLRSIDKGWWPNADTIAGRRRGRGEMRSLWIGAATTGLALTPAGAQDARPELTLDTARAMQQACLEYASERDLGVAIAIYDDAGILVAYSRMDGVSPAVQDLSQWKGQSAARYRTATEQTANWELPSLPHIATIGGGLPIFDAEGNPLGGIGVSGAPVPEDIACGMAALASVGLAAERPNG